MREGGLWREVGSSLKFPGQKGAAQAPPEGEGKAHAGALGVAGQSQWVFPQPGRGHQAGRERQGQVQAPVAGSMCALGTPASSSSSPPPLR